MKEKEVHRGTGRGRACQESVLNPIHGNSCALFSVPIVISVAPRHSEMTDEGVKSEREDNIEESNQGREGGKGAR